MYNDYGRSGFRPKTQSMQFDDEQQQAAPPPPVRTGPTTSLSPTPPPQLLTAKPDAFSPMSPALAARRASPRQPTSTYVYSGANDPQAQADIPDYLARQRGMAIADRAENDGWLRTDAGQLATFRQNQAMEQARIKQEGDQHINSNMAAWERIKQDPTHPQNPANVRQRGQELAALMVNNPSDPRVQQIMANKEAARERRAEREDIRQQRLRYEYGRPNSPDEAMMFAMRDAIRVNPILAMQAFGIGMDNLGNNNTQLQISQGNNNTQLQAAQMNADVMKQRNDIQRAYNDGLLSKQQAELELRKTEGDRNFGLEKMRAQGEIDDRMAKNELSMLEQQEKVRRMTPEGRAEEARQAALNANKSPQEAEMEAKKARGDIPSNNLKPIKYDEGVVLAREFMNMRPNGTPSEFQDYLASKGVYLPSGEGDASLIRKGLGTLGNAISSMFYKPSYERKNSRDATLYGLLELGDGMPSQLSQPPSGPDPATQSPLLKGQEKAMEQRQQQLQQQRDALNNLSMLTPEQQLNLNRLRYPFGQMS